MGRSRASTKKHVPSPKAAVSRKRRRAEESTAKRIAEEPQQQREVKRRVAHQEKEALHPVSHPSHQQVRKGPACPSLPGDELGGPAGSGRLIARTGSDIQIPSPSQTPGDIFLFGDGDCGQLGMGEDVTERLRPFPLSLGPRVVQLALGGMHTAALTAGNRVFTWGVNDEGALGRETAGELWEKSGQSSGEPGDSYRPGLVALPPAAGRLVQLSAGDSHTAALTELGERCWPLGAAVCAVSSTVPLLPSCQLPGCGAGCQPSWHPALCQLAVCHPLIEGVGPAWRPPHGSCIAMPALLEIGRTSLTHLLSLPPAGAVYAWGTYRDSSGVMGFGPHTRIQLTPVLVYDPKKSEDQVVRITSGGCWQQWLGGARQANSTCRAEAWEQVLAHGLFQAAVRNSGPAGRGFPVGACNPLRHVRCSVESRACSPPTQVMCGCMVFTAGADHVAAITRSGALLTWGNGQQGQLGRVGERLSDRVKLPTLLTPSLVPFKRVKGISHRIAGACRAAQVLSQPSCAGLPFFPAKVLCSTPPFMAHGCRRQLWHLCHLCADNRRPCVCLWAEQLRPAGAAQPGAVRHACQLFVSPTTSASMLVGDLGAPPFFAPWAAHCEAGSCTSCHAGMHSAVFCRHSCLLQRWSRRWRAAASRQCAAASTTPW